MKFIFMLIFCLSFNVPAQNFVPLHKDDTNIVKCTVLNNFVTYVYYYLNSGLLTYNNSSTINPTTGNESEIVILENSTLEALDPFGANRKFNVVDEQGTTFLNLKITYRIVNNSNDRLVTYYSAAINGETGSCVLEENVPPGTIINFQF